MVRAYLLSLLVRQRLALKDQFQRRYPHAWLVWEPGIWRVSASPAEQSMGTTRLPSGAAEDHPPQGDALCFELSTAGGNGHTVLRVGREPGSDIVINDTTVSREHLLLTADASARWLLTISPSSKTTFYAGRELAPGVELTLQPADRVRLGDVSLTFYDPPGFLERLQAEARRLAS